MSLLDLYMLTESVPDSATAMVGDWQEAERYWPGCSAAWDVAGGEEWLGGRDIELFQVGPLLFAGSNGSKDHRLFVNGEWADIGNAHIEVSGPGWVKLIGKYRGFSNDNRYGGRLYVPMAVYIPRTKRISIIQVLGPEPSEMVGFGTPQKRAGNISAEKRGNITAEDVRQAALAVLQGGQTPADVIDTERNR